MIFHWSAPKALIVRPSVMSFLSVFCFVHHNSLKCSDLHPWNVKHCCWPIWWMHQNWREVWYMVQCSPVMPCKTKVQAYEWLPQTALENKDHAEITIFNARGIRHIKKPDMGKEVRSILMMLQHLAEEEWQSAYMEGAPQQQGTEPWNHKKQQSPPTAIALLSSNATSLMLAKSWSCPREDESYGVQIILFFRSVDIFHLVWYFLLIMANSN